MPSLLQADTSFPLCCPPETAGDGLNMKEVTADLLVYLKDVSSSF